MKVEKTDEKIIIKQDEKIEKIYFYMTKNPNFNSHIFVSQDFNAFAEAAEYLKAWNQSLEKYTVEGTKSEWYDLRSKIEDLRYEARKDNNKWREVLLQYSK